MFNPFVRDKPDQGNGRKNCQAYFGVDERKPKGRYIKKDRAFAFPIFAKCLCKF